ncbi:MAG: capsular exopolysaccharide synthesis family protein [Verrucomicrobiales bacterium]|jgi:capsular exopolysaccharide synthesis family protein
MTNCDELTGPSPQEDQRAIDPRQLLSKVQEKLWILVLTTILGIAAGVAYVKYVSPVYEATATVEVLSGKRSPVGDGGQNDLKNADALGTIAAILNRISLFQRVMERDDILDHENLEIAAELEPVQRAAGLQRLVQVQIRRDTRLIDVAVEHSDPEVAKLLANAIVNEFIEERSQMEAGATKSSFEMLLGEKEKIDESLETLETMLQSVEKVLVTKSLIEEKETEIQQLLTNLGELHPDVKAARTQVAVAYGELEEQLAKARALIEPALAPEGADQGGNAVSREKKLLLEADLFELSQRALTREIDSERATRDVIVARLKEAEIIKDLDTTPVILAEPAFAPLHPVRPKPVLVCALATGLGFICGLMLIWLSHALNQRIRTVDEAQTHIGVAVLGAVPHRKGIAKVGWLIRRKKRELVTLKNQFQPEIAGGNKKGKPAQAPIRSGRNIEPLVLLSDPGSDIAESFRTLRAKLTLHSRKNDVKSILVTSAVPNEGKSFVAANLAVACAAQAGARTLLIDADLRCPTVDNLLDVKPGEGFAKALTNGESPVPTPSGIPNLDILTAGRDTPNPAEMLSSEAVQQLLKKLTEEYDTVIVDTPPINTVADALLLVPAIDSVLLVARADQTPRNAVIHARKSLEAAGALVAGFVLTGIKRRSGFASNRYYYHYGAGSTDYSRNYG